MNTFRILSIDAWGNKKSGYEWNNWHTVGEISEIPESNQAIIEFFIEEDYLKEGCESYIEVEDDGYNILICDKGTKRPLYAIEYGTNN